MLAWDQCASSFDNSPVAATVEKIAAGWLLDILDLPRESAVGFGTSATACTLSALSAARRSPLARAGWDFDRDGLIGAPEIKVDLRNGAYHGEKALRLLGFGMARLIVAPVDAQGRIDPDRLPPLDDRTILCLQAGEVNAARIRSLRPADRGGAQGRRLVHVDGAFGQGPRLLAPCADQRRGRGRQLDHRWP
jgi:aromatic-L-amino-acid decarboxylase